MEFIIGLIFNFLNQAGLYGAAIIVFILKLLGKI